MKNKKIVIVVIVIVAIVAALVAIFGMKSCGGQETPPVSSTSEVSISGSVEVDHTVQMPIDFAALQKQYPDVYAWITIPDSKVDYAIVQAPEGEDDDYYLRKNLDGEKETAGSLYTQATLNNKEFTDNVTIIYGHNMRNKSMFGTLDDIYQSESKRDTHKTIKVYIPGKVLTYEVAFAVTVGDEHLIYTYDCNYDQEGYQSLLDAMNNPPYSPSWHNPEIELTTEDKLIILSTCNSVDDQRYLIGAKLVSVEDAEYVASE